MRANFRRFAAVFLLLLPAWTAAAHPALWVVRDADTTIYLFGTVHLLPDHTRWRYPALDKALTRSQALYIEVTDSNPLHLAPLVMQYGIDAAHPLSARLSASEEKTLASAAADAGVPGGAGALDTMRPWLAAVTLDVAPLMKAGMDPSQGVDKQLQAQMQKAGKPVQGLETAAQQIRFLADLPESVQLAFLRSTLHDYARAGTELKALVADWERGDVAAIARLEDSDMRHESPLLYQRLLVDRNKAWATRIAALLKQPGAVFIAVGAAHLAGPDSVQHQLEKRGLKVSRIDSRH